MSKDAIRLTKRQKEVVRDIRNGAVFATDCDVKGAQVCFADGTYYHIHSGVFFGLYNKGVIWQDPKQHHNYDLTHLGKTINLEGGSK